MLEILMATLWASAIALVAATAILIIAHIAYYAGSLAIIALGVICVDDCAEYPALCESRDKAVERGDAEEAARLEYEIKRFEDTHPTYFIENYHTD